MDRPRVPQPRNTRGRQHQPHHRADTAAETVREGVDPQPLADDLVQDGLERAWSRFYLWRRNNNLRAWLFTILHNQYANMVRCERRRPTLVPLGDWGYERAVEPAQEHYVEIGSVAVALRQRPDEQRAVILLVGLEGTTYAEAAEILEIPIGTVMSRLARGRGASGCSSRRRPGARRKERT